MPRITRRALAELVANKRLQEALTPRHPHACRISSMLHVLPWNHIFRRKKRKAQCKSQPTSNRAHITESLSSQHIRRHGFAFFQAFGVKRLTLSEARDSRNWKSIQNRMIQSTENMYCTNVFDCICTCAFLWCFLSLPKLLLPSWQSHVRL